MNSPEDLVQREGGVDAQLVEQVLEGAEVVVDDVLAGETDVFAVGVGAEGRASVTIGQ